MKLTSAQRDELASYVAAQDVAGAVKFVEALVASDGVKQDEEAAPKKVKTAR